VNGIRKMLGTRPLWGREKLPTHAPHKPAGSYDLGQQRKQIGRQRNTGRAPERALAQVDIWSTDATRARERFSYWRDAVCHAVFNISIEAPPERFSAHITARSAGPLRLRSTALKCRSTIGWSIYHPVWR
jgi:hypothetical protein